MSSALEKIFKSDLFAILVLMFGIAGMLYILGWGNFIEGLEILKKLSGSFEWLRNLAQHGIV